MKTAGRGLHMVPSHVASLVSQKGSQTGLQMVSAVTPAVALQIGQTPIPSVGTGSHASVGLTTETGLRFGPGVSSHTYSRVSSNTALPIGVGRISIVIIGASLAAVWQSNMYYTSSLGRKRWEMGGVPNWRSLGKPLS